MPNAKVEALLNPASIAIIGANDDPQRWPSRIHRSLTNAGYQGSVIPVSPKYDQVWGQTCYSDLSLVPEPVDHLVVLVGAQTVPDLLLSAADKGVRSATVYANGFDDAGTDEGRVLTERLRTVVSRTGLAVSGPNCMGNVYGRSQLSTIPDHRIERVAEGPVALLGQSAGILMALNRALSERAMQVGAVVTSGNELDLTTGDYIDYLADDPEIKVIVAFIEAVRDPEQLLRAVTKARDRRKQIVAVKTGLSASGRQAALAHTGALVGSVEAFDAVAGSLGLTRVDTLDEAVELVEYAAHAPSPRSGTGVAVVTLSGGVVGLALDAAERVGRTFADLTAETQHGLSAILGESRETYNPLDTGFVGFTDQKAWLELVKLVAADPGVGLVLIQRELPRVPSERDERYLDMLENALAQGLGASVAAFSIVSHGSSAYSTDVRSRWGAVPFLQGVDRAVGTAFRMLDAAFAPTSSAPFDSHVIVGGRQANDSEHAPAARVVAEADARALLESYGFVTAREAIVSSPDEAVEAASELGWPVVVKALSTDTTHRSDKGCVVLDCRSDSDVVDAFNVVAQAVRTLGRPGNSMLVCEQLEGGLEIFVGAHRDVEMGFVVAAGAGGTELELYRDVATARVPLDSEAASALLGRTRIDQVLRGYRGGTVYDRDGVVRALTRLSRLVVEQGSDLTSVDVNPLLVRPGDGGCVVLDRLVVARGVP